MTDPTHISANDLLYIEAAFRAGHSCMLGMGGVVTKAYASDLSIGSSTLHPAVVDVEMTIRFTADAR